MSETADFTNFPRNLRFSSRFEQVDSIGFNQTSQLRFPTLEEEEDRLDQDLFRRRHTFISESQSVA